MGWLCCVSKPDNEEPMRNVPLDEPHSRECSYYNSLNEKETSYIDRAKLKRALETIFDEHGQRNLDYGLRTRNDMWTFWAPRKVRWAELEPYID